MDPRRLLALAALAGCTSSAPATPVPDAQTSKPEAPPENIFYGALPVPDPPPAPASNGEFDVAGATRSEQATTPRTRTIQYPKLATRWTARVGQTTFRTTMALVDGKLVIGTHGATLEGKNEASDGVYVLDARTGKQDRLIATPGSGDRDVGGVAIDGATVYFSADNGQIVAASLDGKVLWKQAAEGKVRPAPALAELDGEPGVEVVVGDESGALYALDGLTGKPQWTVKTGESEYNHRGFIGAAAIVDLDGDKQDDVIAGARDGILAAYRGTDGGVLWQYPGNTGIHASPVLADFDQDGAPEVLQAWSYGELTVFDARTGRVRWGTVLQQDGAGIEGLFATPTPLPGKPGVIVAPTSWWEDEDGVILVGVSARMFRSFEGRVTATAVVLDLDNDGREEAVLGTEKGRLLAFTAEGGRAELAKLGGKIEAPALVADVDGDGKYELLVASNDGVLTCFSTPATSKPTVPRFRGESPHNRGDLGAIALGWRSTGGAIAPPEPQPGLGIRIDYLRCCQDLVEDATRAPAPDNSKLLQAASKCNSLASVGMERAGALVSIKETAAGAPLPSSCN